MRKGEGRSVAGWLRGAEDGIRTCGRRWVRGAYMEVECGGEEVGRSEVRM